MAVARKDDIKAAYRGLGKAHGFYDGMMLGTTVLGRMVLKLVWQMKREEALEYQAEAFAPIPGHFKGKLLEVPVGTGVLSIPVWKDLLEADITCLDYSEKMLDAAKERAKEMGVSHLHFLQGDVGALPFADETFAAVVSLNGFHAFPDKEAAYRETFRVLKRGGIFTGCFYVKGNNLHTDKVISGIYVKKGFFTEPFETMESLQERLSGMYEQVQLSKVQSIAVFHCQKG
ncbi:MAG: class I SAM-dependent methyltransferase [Blautia sp.]|nr:class I SAM-dependent methyltransferase [Blautia sp.]